jgi:hypothetical protein
LYFQPQIGPVLTISTNVRSARYAAARNGAVDGSAASEDYHEKSTDLQMLVSAFRAYGLPLIHKP